MERGKVALAGGDTCSHGGKRFDDTVHGTPTEGGITTERAVKRLAGEETGEEPKCRARIATVERAGKKARRAAEGVEPAASDLHTKDFTASNVSMLS